MRLRILLFAAAVLTPTAPAQGTAEDYERAASLERRWGGRLRRFDPAFRWLPGGRGLAWRDGEHTVVVEAPGGRRSRVESLVPFGLADGPVSLRPRRRRRASRRGGRPSQLTFVNALDRRVRLFWVDPGGESRAYGALEPGEERTLGTYAGHTWLGDLRADDLAGIFVAGPWPGRAVFDAEARRRATEGAAAPPQREHRLRVAGGDLVRIDREGREVGIEGALVEGFEYREPVAWSPDGTKAVVMRVRPVETRRIPLVESAPDDRLQPRLHWHPYRKPGDPLPERRPCIVDLVRGRLVGAAAGAFADAWSLTRFRFSEEGSEVYCLHDVRGHQERALCAIDVASGAVREVIGERSATFIDYSQKTWLHWLPGERLVWMSERDGHNHLYLVDARAGKLLRALTHGPWNVRRVLRVDEEAGQLWLSVMGYRPDEDPYHEHLVRVGLDGGEPALLTAGDGTHEIEFSPDGSLFLDRWSRIDRPRVTELRDARSGALVAELGRDEDEALRAAGFRPAQRFVAKGRDGATDIHGIIIRPSTFEPGRRYPVIEAIYAGPHDHHVPKRFGLGLRNRRLAELGFIVVQIDGMGTNWRSKRFHDVCWQDLKDSGLPDRIAWLRAAAARHAELDLSRVGIFGGSAGGQSTVAALLHHGDFYRVGVADCGCHDNRMDKIWWNEAWMGRMGPHYAENSNVTHAAKLRGRLLLTVGLMDRNVDPASTLQLVDALIAADRDFDFIAVPSGGHGVGESPHLARRRQDFFVRHLLGVEPRR